MLHYLSLTHWFELEEVNFAAVLRPLGKSISRLRSMRSLKHKLDLYPIVLNKVSNVTCGDLYIQQRKTFYVMLEVTRLWTKSISLPKLSDRNISVRTFRQKYFCEDRYSIWAYSLINDLPSCN